MYVINAEPVEVFEVEPKDLIDWPLQDVVVIELMVYYTAQCSRYLQLLAAFRLVRNVAERQLYTGFYTYSAMPFGRQNRLLKFKTKKRYD